MRLPLLTRNKCFLLRSCLQVWWGGCSMASRQEAMLPTCSPSVAICKPALTEQVGSVQIERKNQGAFTLWLTWVQLFPLRGERLRKPADGWGGFFWLEGGLWYVRLGWKRYSCAPRRKLSTWATLCPFLRKDRRSAYVCSIAGNEFVYVF